MQQEDTHNQEEDYKFVLSLLKGFLQRRKSIGVVLVIFLIAGIFTVLLTPNTYTSKVTFIAQGSSGPKVSGLNSIAKILSGGGATNTDQMSDLPLFLYPQIVESVAYQKKLSKTLINLKTQDSPISFENYVLNVEKKPFTFYLKKYTIGLPNLLFGSKKNLDITKNKIDTIQYLTPNERKVLQSLKEKFEFIIDEESGSIDISISLQSEPVAAAQLAQSAERILEQEIIRFRIAKAKEKYQFLEKQYQQQKEKYEVAQQRLASYIDRNKFNATNVSTIRRTQLQNENALLYSIYSDLEQQLLAQSIKIQEDTPTFTVINPAIVPSVPSNTSSIKIIALFLIAGFMCSLIWYVYKISYQYIKSLWQEV